MKERKNESEKKFTSIIHYSKKENSKFTNLIKEQLNTSRLNHYTKQWTILYIEYGKIKI